MSDTVLSLQEVVRVYTQGERSLTVLNRLNLEVRAGEVVALVGPSGSGKTTLLQIAGLLDTPTSGQVMLKDNIMHYSSSHRGQTRRGASDASMTASDASSLTLPRKRWRGDDAERTLARRKYLGFVYQFHHLLPEFSALENVMLPQMLAGVPPASAKAKAMELLEALGLAARATHRPAKLSGGEQQRVAIARALANDPALLLADEPTGNLDPATAETVFGMLMQLVKQKGLAVLVATHNLELAARMDRTVRLEGGVLK